jgi:hypothetical protein
MTSPSRFAIAAAAIALLFSAHPLSAQTAPPPPGTPPQGQTMTFDQYKARQMQQMQRAQARVAQRLADPNLPADQHQRLEHQQAQLAKFAAMPPDQQDQVLHRCVRIGVIDAGELQAFRQQQRERAEAKKNASTAPGGNSNDNFWPSQGQSPN